MKLYREIVTKKSLSGLFRIRPHRGRLDERKQRPVSSANTSGGLGMDNTKITRLDLGSSNFNAD